jgi:hypothetical protein
LVEMSPKPSQPSLGLELEVMGGVSSARAADAERVASSPQNNDSGDPEGTRSRQPLTVPRWSRLLPARVASPLPIVSRRPLPVKKMSVPASQLPLFDLSWLGGEQLRCSPCPNEAAQHVLSLRRAAVVVHHLRPPGDRGQIRAELSLQVHILKLAQEESALRPREVSGLSLTRIGSRCLNSASTGC